MSGSGGGGGYDYQANAFAFIASYALAGWSLNWASRSDDVPVAISIEAPTGGEDLFVEMANGSKLDVQAKYHARFEKKFQASLVALIGGLIADPTLRGVMLVDSTSSNSITRDLKRDIQRMGQGRTDGLSPTGKILRKVLKSAKLQPDASVMRRLSIAIYDLDEATAGEELALSALRSVLADPQQIRAAWQRLGKRGLEGTKLSGRSDLAVLVNFLEPTLLIAHDGKSAAAILHRYRTWLAASVATFPVIGFRSVHLPAEKAWDEMRERETFAKTISSLAEELQRYHDPQEEAVSTVVNDSLHADDLVLMGDDVVTIGAAGSGKSTLVRRVLSTALAEGLLAMHVPLRKLMARFRDDTTFDEALLDVALQGSDIEGAARQSLQPTLLLADGLDECGTRREEIAAQLLSWRRSHPHARLVVTTRSFGYAASDFPGFVQAEIEPLTPGAIYTIAEDILAMYFGNREKAAVKSVEFEEILERNQTAAVAARTPLLLACLTALFAQGLPLPGKRAALFRDIVHLLRDQQVPETAAPVSEPLADRVMEIAGWLLIDEPTQTRTELRDRIGDQLHRDKMAESPFQGGELAGKALMFWEERRLMERLTTGAREIVTFVQMSLGEFAAARFAAHLTPEEIRAWVKRVFGSASWRASLLLAAGIDAAARDVVGETLLMHENRDDVDSIGALWAADALAEAETVSPELGQRVMDALVERIRTNQSVSSTVEAAERLIALRDLLPGAGSRLCKPLLDHEDALIRLAAEAVVLADDPSELPADLPEQWLDNWLPIVHFQLGNIPMPPHNEELPLGADSLLTHTVQLAFEALFRTVAEELALEVMTRFLAKRPELLFVHVAVERAVNAFGTPAIGDKFRELTPSSQRFWSNLFSFDTERHRRHFRAFLDVVAAAVGAPETQQPVERWRLLSRLISALHFDYLEHDLGKLGPQDTELLQFAIDRTVVALGLDRDVLRRELASAYEVLDHLTPRGIYPHLQPVRVRVFWRRAAKPSDLQRVRALTKHPSPVARYVGEKLLECGGLTPLP